MTNSKDTDTTNEATWYAKFLGQHRKGDAVAAGARTGSREVEDEGRSPTGEK